MKINISESLKLTTTHWGLWRLDWIIFILVIIGASLGFFGLEERLSQKNYFIYLSVLILYVYVRDTKKIAMSTQACEHIEHERLKYERKAREEKALEIGV